MTTRFIGATEIAEQLGTSKAYAYKVIRKLNAELEQKGCLIVQGRVSREYFEQRYCVGPQGGSEEAKRDVR